MRSAARFAGRGKHGGDNRWRRGVDALSLRGVERCANLIRRRTRAAAPARVADRRGGETSTHQSIKQQVMSDETPIVAAARHHARQGLRERPRRWRLAEDGLDGERCVVINRVPHLLLREAALAIMRAWPRSRARPPTTRGGRPLFRAWRGPPWRGAPASPIDSGCHRPPCIRRRPDHGARLQ